MSAPTMTRRLFLRSAAALTVSILLALPPAQAAPEPDTPASADAQAVADVLAKVSAAYADVVTVRVALTQTSSGPSYFEPWCRAARSWCSGPTACAGS